MKRIIIIALILLAVGAGAVYIFKYDGWNRIKDIFSKKETATSTEEENQASDTRTGLFAVTSRPIFAPVLSLKQRTVWYFDDSGQLFRSQFDGRDEQSFALPDPLPIETAYWPLAGNDFIEKTAGQAGRFRYYNAAQQKFIDLPGAIVNLAWLPDGKRIIYVWRRSDGKFELKIANPDSTNYTKLADIAEAYALRPADSGNYVLLVSSASVPNPKIISLDIDRLTMSDVASEGKNLDALPSPDGTKILFTRLNGSTQQPDLWLFDRTSNTAKNLSLATSVDKIVWAGSGDRFYFALPEAVASGDDLVTQKTKDTIYSYVLATNEAVKLPHRFDSLQIDVRDPLLVDSEEMLFVRNGWDGKLYRLNLK